MSRMEKSKTLIQVSSEDWLPNSCLFANCHSRGFISESGVVFNFVQRLSKCQEPLSHSEMIKASRKYRSVIHSWYLKIVDDLTAQDGQMTANDDLIRQSNVLHQMEIAWHLCEILYINVSSTGTLLAQLLNWIKWHFTYYVKLADEMIVSSLPQMHENYWDIIMFFALRGDMENAALLLELHSESKSDPIFMVVQDLLKKFPIINSSNSFVIHEYYLRWGFWHESVEQAIENHSTNTSQKRSHQQLLLLLKLLVGDLESFKSVNHLFHSWYQLMVSYALFTDPCLKDGVDILIEKTMNTYYESSNDSGKSLFDKLILSSLNYDLIDVIKQSSLCFDDNWWFVTHFVDLIYNSARYADYQITDISLIRDSFVVNYANALFAHRRRFWQLSIEYLIHVGEQAADRQHFILASLERVSFDSESELQRLLTTCRRFEFGLLELSLCRQQARKWLRGSHPKLGSALFWAIRAKDKLLINHIVDQILRQYLESNQDNDVDADTITNIGGSIVLSERLIFLCKYHEFRQLCQRGQYESAANILVDDMITSNAIPDFFQTKVIEDCLPLIQPQKSPISMSMPGPLQLNSKQISKLISSLEQVLYRARSHFSHDGDQLTMTMWSDHFGNHDQQQRQDKEGDESYRRRIQRIENQLRVAAACHLANHFVL